MLDRGVYLTSRARAPTSPFDGGTADDHRPLQELLAARLGHAVHEADRRRRRRPRPHQGRRHRRGQLREPGPEQPALPRLGDQLLGRPDAHRRPDERRHRLRLAGQQPHPRRRRDRPPADHRQRQEARDRVLGRRQGLRTRPGSRPSSKRPGPRSRSSATTRSPAATTRPRPRSAAPGCRPRPSRPTWPRPRARPAPTSSSSTRTGAPSTTRPRSSTSRSWPR